MSAAVKELLSRLPAGSVAPASAVAPVASALPVSAVLRPLLPRGLRRGSTVEVAMGGLIAVGGGGFDGTETGAYEEPVAPGGCTLLLTLLAGVSAEGSWCALVGAPGLGLAAAAEAGVELARLALVPAPGRDWARVVGALLDGFDLVAVHPPTRPIPGQARALSARARNQGAVLVSLGPWPGSDLRLATDADVWEGLGSGSGRLRSRRLSVRMSGRGVAGGRPARAELLLPVVGRPVRTDRPGGDQQALSAG